MLKEPNYVSMLMGSFGSMVESTEESAQVVRMMNFSKNSDDTSKVKFNLTEPFHWYYKYRGCVDNNSQKRYFPCSFEEAWKTTKWCHYVFALTEPFHWYYKYRGCVDNNNQKRHFPCSFEEAWKTTKWCHRVFAFVISVAEINCYQVAQHFFGFPEDETTVSLRKQLARQLIENDFDGGTRGRKAWRDNCFYDEHKFTKAPKFAMRWDGRAWIYSEKQEYPQRCCVIPGCRKRVRTYCACSPEVWKCPEHYGHHVLTCLEAQK